MQYKPPPTNLISQVDAGGIEGTDWPRMRIILCAALARPARTTTIKRVCLQKGGLVAVELPQT